MWEYFIVNKDGVIVQMAGQNLESALAQAALLGEVIPESGPYQVWG